MLPQPFGPAKRRKILDAMTAKHASNAPGDESSEGDVNLSPRRKRFEEEHLGAQTRAILAEDAKHFLHQSLSTPCVNALRAASGIWLEDVEGRRIMDFHGNSVHQVGHGHPRVVAAVKQALDTLPFSPRRFTNDYAVRLAAKLTALAPGDLDKIPICFGRTGSMCACERYGIVPDMVVIGKGLGGGIFPMAALLARGELDVAADRALGHYTHEKSSVGCAAALATIDVIESEGLLDRAVVLGERALERMRAMQARHPVIVETRGVGLLLAIELAEARIAEDVLYRCLARGLSFKVGQGNVIVLAPPLVVEEADLDRALAIVEEEIAAAAAC